MNNSKWALAAAVAAIFSTADVATADDVTLSHFEPLQQLTLLSLQETPAGSQLPPPQSLSAPSVAPSQS